ncbi:Zn-ribbon domain-containing OB-fold protein [Saccharopolyspora sp. NPDC000995]
MSRPVVDRDSAPWWAALAAHRLLLQTCDHCRTHRLPPRALCNACGSFDWQWTEANGTGTIATWTVSHRTYQPDHTTPYVVVLVRLAEADDVILPGGWAGAPDGSDLAVDLQVRACFQDLPATDIEPAAALLVWQPNGSKS